MNYLWPASALILVLLASCYAGVTNSDTSDYIKHPSLFNDLVEDDDEAFRRDLEDEQHLLRVKDELLGLRGRFLGLTRPAVDDVEKRYKPSGFIGSRGKRFIPGLESLLLARYYQGNLMNAEKWKRQPHLGFHGSRG